MTSVGIKELKAKLSSYVDKARKGHEIIITDHGEEVAMIVPISKERRVILEMVKAGEVEWSGGKPRGNPKPPKIKGKTTSEIILEDRR